MSMSEHCTKGAGELAATIRAHQVTSREVVDAEPPLIAEAVATWCDMIWADFAGSWPHMDPIAGPGLHAFIAQIEATGLDYAVDQARQAAAYMARHSLGAAWAKFFHDHPIVLAPVCCERPLLVGDDIGRVGEIFHANRMVLPINTLGLPSCAVPHPHSAAGGSGGMRAASSRPRRPRVTPSGMSGQVSIHQ